MVVMTDSEIIAVVVAHQEGKKIQARRVYGKPHPWENLDWSDVNAHWQFAEFDYRVAPEPRKPREFWIHLNASGMHEVHETTENRSHCGHCILVREVIE